LSHARTALREKTLAEGLIEGVIAVILSRWSRRSDLIRPMYSHSPCCRASRIDTARSAIQYRDSENKTQSEIFEGQGARLLISRLSEASRTPLTSPRLPQVRSQFQNADRWTTWPSWGGGGARGIYRESETGTQWEIFQGHGARLVISRLSEVSGTPLASPRLPQVRSQFQNADRWTTRA